MNFKEIFKPATEEELEVKHQASIKKSLSYIIKQYGEDDQGIANTLRYEKENGETVGRVGGQLQDYRIFASKHTMARYIDAKIADIRKRGSSAINGDKLPMSLARWFPITEKLKEDAVEYWTDKMARRNTRGHKADLINRVRMAFTVLPEDILNEYLDKAEQLLKFDKKMSYDAVLPEDPEMFKRFFEFFFEAAMKHGIPAVDILSSSVRPLVFPMYQLNELLDYFYIEYKEWIYEFLDNDKSLGSVICSQVAVFEEGACDVDRYVLFDDRYAIL